MTLILTAVIGTHVFQVSDRRLTYLDGRIADNDRNKAVLIDDRVAMAYTGLATIDGERADFWLARNLCEDNASLDMAERMKVLAESATIAFRKLPRTISAAQKRHAFVGVGWVRIKEDEGAASPIVISVSNALSPNGAWIEAARDKFEVNHVVGTPDGSWCSFASHGCRVPRSDWAFTYRRVRDFAKREISPEAVAHFLTSRIEVAAEKDAAIGRNMMVVSMPHPSLNKTDAFLTDVSFEGRLTSNDSRFFRYVEANAKRGIYFSPIFVTPGEAIDMTVVPLNQSGSDVEITARYLKKKRQPWSAVCR